MRKPHVLLLVALILGVAPRARAQDRRAENAARDALQAAQADYATNAYGKAIARLSKAFRSCGRCSTRTRATLLRDLGAIQFASGDEEGAAARFVEAAKLEPRAELSQRYDTPEVHAAWVAAKDEAELAKAQQPTGDFVHTPPAEQAVRTPVPLYFESEAQLARVTVRYRLPGSKEYGRLELSRVGKGWGGAIPCAELGRGILRYYVVGVDASGSPVATSGDPKRPFFVPIRASIRGPSPSLPGQEPPKQCAPSGQGVAQAPKTPAEEELEPKRAPEEAPPGKPTKGRYARFWLGIAGSLDISSLPADSDVCRVDAAGNFTGSAGYVCSDPHGGMFPADPKTNDAVPAGKAGTVGGGFAPGDVRIMIAADYAVGPNVLLGARLGYVANGYANQADSPRKGLSKPIHAEARVTLVLGDEPLARVGFAPVLLAGVGAAEWDVSNVVQVTQTGVPGQQPILAWKTSGPFFVTGGGGARYTLSAAFAFTSTVRISAAFGNGTLFSISPDLALQYGF